MVPPPISDYRCTNIISLWNNDFDLITNIDDIEISFKALIDIIYFIIKENITLKQKISLFRK